MKRGQVDRDATVRQEGGAEWARLATPVLALLAWILRFYHWPIACLSLLYALSGLTIVQPGEVALVLRMGRLVGETPGAQVHTSGLLFALPAPIDEVIRVDVSKIHSVRITDLASGSGNGQPDESGAMTSTSSFSQRDSIDPEKDGYCLTGDDNVLQAVLLARYQVRDPLIYALQLGQPEELLRDAVNTAMVASAGSMGIEEMMAEGRDVLAARVRMRAQVLLDASEAGMELVAVEFEQLTPPRQVLPAFREVVSSMIDAVTLQQEAMEYRATQVPAAKAEAETQLSKARARGADLLGRARGEAAAFNALLAEYTKAPELVRMRLYRETLERALAPARKRFVPPPIGERYNNLRISVPF